MPDVQIENPILNSPYHEPSYHYRFSDDGITDDIVDGRRKSTYIAPIPAPRGRGRQLTLPTFHEIPRENPFVDQLRASVKAWRHAKYPYITATTQRLLEYWTDPERENLFFFCQIEALETAIYLTEVARHANDDVEKKLREENSQYNADLFRVAFKMATGSGKTVVMAMLIAWQVLNKRANARDVRFTNRFLIVTPGNTIKDRLRVLQPNDPESYYRQRDIVPPDLIAQLNTARIVISNFHQFQRRERIEASKTTKQILLQGREDEDSPFRETFDQMVLRVCASMGGPGEIIVINDEAHHCYQTRTEEKQEKIEREEKEEAKQRREDARLWFEGLTHVKRKLGIKVIYDLSATPFFLKGSGYGEGTIFPWVVSDFSLVDAIESGIVKIPRVPVTDNTQDPEGPVNRLIWANVREKLPTHSKVKLEDLVGEPTLPQELEQALWSLYNDYEARYLAWEKHKATMPPVMIVVCSNTLVSSLVYRYIAGWERQLPDESVAYEEGRLSLFNNVEKAEWLPRPNTILVDSRQLESGENMSDDFKRVASGEIEAFIEEYRRRYPERSTEDISESDLLREVLNTVGKRGKLGENIRCVVSVSMLTEGWDANNVTHILGIRAFSTQLICEQVVGRGLRRMSYEINDDGKFNPEYAEVYGVPFAFIPTSGRKLTDTPGKPTYHVQTKDAQSDSHISFPRVVGYRYEAPDGELVAKFTSTSRVVLSPEEFPTRTVVAGVTGIESEHMLRLEQKRFQRIQYEIAQKVVETAFTDEDGAVLVWRFPEVLRVVRQWFDGGYLIMKDSTSLDMLQIGEKRDQVVHAVIEAIRRGEVGERQESIIPILATDMPEGSTRDIAFDTIRPVYQTGDRCPLNFAVLDTQRWEQVVVETLEHMPEVVRYVKNYRLGFTIPYTYRAMGRSYVPDFIAVLNNGLNLIIEVSGEDRDNKRAKVDTARELWVPAVNQHGGFGMWQVVEITDPYLTEQTIRNVVHQNI